jgi:hypothetical protein
MSRCRNSASALVVCLTTAKDSVAPLFPVPFGGIALSVPLMKEPQAVLNEALATANSTIA